MNRKLLNYMFLFDLLCFFGIYGKNCQFFHKNCFLKPITKNTSYVS